MRLSIRTAIGSGAFLLAAVGAANAVPVSSLHPNNVGISSFGFSFDAGTNTITLRETWTGTGPGIVQITGLENTVQYTVVKIITNSSGTHWTSFAQELLDPAGFADDTDDPAPAFAPPGFTSSNDTDGLSFAQGSGIPRTSIAFGSTAADELGGRDFLDFFGGTLLAGGVDTMNFGLSDNNGVGSGVCVGVVCPNQPFLLVQRPNALSVVPQPSTLVLLGAGLLVAAFVAHRRIVAR
ncbi:MAG TPA: PEP-CTERM sorting domain-containing protein [Candidatus Nitrosocosmicus sp.]|jgi:hypothetical protein|nr:PEP-CTERM sorting domain-containing protein [Candidatus Nitrosocosmicus sp.]